MIIVEGGDNVGKTTLVKEMLKLDPWLHEIKRKRFKPDRGESIGTSYIDCLTPPDGDLARHAYGVVDRLLASEYIYGDLFRNGARIHPDERSEIILMLAGYGSVIVHCDPPNEAILEAWYSREQLYNDPIIIAEAYRSRINDIFKPLPVIRYDWTKDDGSEIRRILQHHHELVPNWER